MILDIITLCLVAFGFYQGYSNGIIQTIFSALSLFIGIIAALKLSDFTITFLENTFNFNQAVNIAVGFVLTFVIVMILIRYIGKSLEKLVNTIQIGGINKLLGGVFLGFFYAVLVSFAVYLMNKIDLIGEQTKTASITYKYLEPLPIATQGIGKALQPMFSEFWDNMIEAMDEIKEKGDEFNDSNNPDPEQ